MDSYRDVIELGPLKYSEIVHAVAREYGELPEAARHCPTPYLSPNLRLAVVRVCTYLFSFDTLIFAHPDLALLESLQHLGFSGSVVVCVPPDLPADLLGDLRSNVPQGLCVSFRRPRVDLTATVPPVRAAAVCVGLYLGPELQLIQAWARDSLAALSGRWFGETALLEPMEGPTTSRPEGWAMVDAGRQLTMRITPAGTFPFTRIAKVGAL